MADICQRRHGGATTSVEAFDSIEQTLPEQRAVILRLIAKAGDSGMTCYEASERLGRPQNAISGRFSELKRSGLITDSGERRPTLSGCSARVYVVACVNGRHVQRELF